MRNHTMKVPARSSAALIVGAAVAAIASARASDVRVGAGKGKAPKNSPALAKPLKEANDDIKAKKYSDAIAKLKAAEGMAGKTPADQYLIDEMLSFSYIKTQQYPEAAKSMEAELDSGMVPQADQPTLIKQLATINYQIKNYDKAIDFGNRAIKGGFADDAISTIVGQSVLPEGRLEEHPQVRGAHRRQPDQGRPDPEQRVARPRLQRLHQAPGRGLSDARRREDGDLLPEARDLGAAALRRCARRLRATRRHLFQTYRLMLDTDVLKDPSDYTEMAELALDAGSPGDAQNVLEKAQAKSVFTDQRSKDRAQRLLDSAKKRAAADQRGSRSSRKRPTLRRPA